MTRVLEEVRKWYEISKQGFMGDEVWPDYSRVQALAWLDAVNGEGVGLFSESLEQRWKLEVGLDTDLDVSFHGQDVRVGKPDGFIRLRALRSPEVEFMAMPYDEEDKFISEMSKLLQFVEAWRNNVDSGVFV